MEMKSYNNNRKLEDTFTKDIKSILGNYFIVKDIQADLKEGTDFLILKMNPFRIAVRLRRYEYYLKYPDEFTIRYKLPSGYKTEYAKIMEGLVDYLFYGFINKEETTIISYFIGDLNVFRNIKNIDKYPIIYENKTFDHNKLAVYKLGALPKNFILQKVRQEIIPDKPIKWNLDGNLWDIA